MKAKESMLSISLECYEIYFQQMFPERVWIKIFLFQNGSVKLSTEFMSLFGEKPKL